MTLDGAGNVVLAVSGAQPGTSPALQVLAESTATYYGVSMTAGDVYTVAGGPSNTLATLSGPSSLTNIGSGNLYFTDGAASSANLDEFSGAPTTGVPVVSSVSPNTGPAAGSTSVTVTGTGLAGATAVDFGNANPGTITADSATSITVTSPAGTGTVNVQVTTPVGTSVTSSADQFTYAAAVSGGTVALYKSTLLIGNYGEKVSGTGWTHDTTVTLNECSTTNYSAATCDSHNQSSPVTLLTGRSAGIFKSAVIDLAVGAIDSNGDTCGVVGSTPCYVVVVGNTTGDTTASGELGFSLPGFTLKTTTDVLGNYVDAVKAVNFPIGDAVVAQECDASASVPSTVSTHCDSATQISGTSGASGKVVFTSTGVKLGVGSAYSDTAAGTCQLGGSCDIGVTDSDNSAIGVSATVGFASPPTVTLKETIGVIGNYVDAVKAAGFPIGDPVVAKECDSNVVIPTTVAPDCDSSTQVTGTAGARGAVVFSPTGVKLLVGSTFSDGADGACSFGGTCEIVVTDSANPGIGTDEDVTFATPTVTLKEASNVPPNYIDKVTATKFAVGDTVTAQECDSTVTSANMATNCDSATKITGTVSAAGGVAFSPTGVTILVGTYSDTADGTGNLNGSADIVVTDSATGAYIATPVGLA